MVNFVKWETTKLHCLSVKDFFLSQVMISFSNTVAMIVLPVSNLLMDMEINRQLMAICWRFWKVSYRSTFNFIFCARAVYLNLAFVICYATVWCLLRAPFLSDVLVFVKNQRSECHYLATSPLLAHSFSSFPHTRCSYKRHAVILANASRLRNSTTLPHNPQISAAGQPDAYVLLHGSTL